MPAAASAIARATLGSAPPGTSLLASLIAPSIVRPGMYLGNDSRSARGDTDGIFGAPGDWTGRPRHRSFSGRRPATPSSGSSARKLLNWVPAVHLRVIE